MPTYRDLIIVIPYGVNYSFAELDAADVVMRETKPGLWECLKNHNCNVDVHTLRKEGPSVISRRR